MFEFLHSISDYLFIALMLVNLYALLLLRRVGKDVPVISRNREAGLGWWAAYGKRSDDVQDGVYGSKVQFKYLMSGLAAIILLIPVTADMLYVLFTKLFN